jgi:hypothetical protein
LCCGEVAYSHACKLAASFPRERHTGSSLPAPLGRGLRRASQACGLATSPLTRRAHSTSSQLTRPTRRANRRGTGSTMPTSAC